MTSTTLETEAGDDRRATWLELFFDLAFAAAIAQVGGTLSHDYSLGGLLRFGFLFLLIWSAWIGHTLFSTRYDTDDLVQRVLTLGQMFAVAVMAVNADGPLDGRSSAGFAAAYGALRLVLAAQYLRARLQQGARETATHHAVAIAAAAILWLLSSVAPPAVRFGLWALALLVDLGTPRLLQSRERAHHPAHLPERFGLFTLILLGESLAAMMSGMKRQEFWSPAAAVAAMAGIGIAFGIWWCYFHLLQAAAPRPIRSALDGKLQQRWAGAHLPLCFGIALTAIGVEHVISVGGVQPLRGTGTWVLSLGGAAVLAALAGIAGSDPARPPSRARLGVFLAGLIFSAGAGTQLAPVVLVTVLLAGVLLLTLIPIRQPASA